MRFLLSAGMLAGLALTSFAQDKPSKKEDKHVKMAGKVCVAVIGNASPESLFVDRLADRITQDLKDDKLDAVRMESVTTLRQPLRMTPDNAGEFKERGCDFLLLTQVTKPRSRPLPTDPPVISIGKKPSLDASDSLTRGPVYRESLRVEFALFHSGAFDPSVDGYIQDESTGHVLTDLMPAMDRVASRIIHELKKRK